MAFDTLPYLVMLSGDLGLETRRIEGWWMEVWEAYGPRGFGGLVGEWKNTRRSDGKGGKD